MTPYTVQATSRYGQSLENIAFFIYDRSGYVDRAWAYIDRIEARAQKLAATPHIGARYDHITPGLRMVPFERSARIFFIVNDVDRTVTLIDVTYRGQLLRIDDKTA